jgi:membrane protein
VVRGPGAETGRGAGVLHVFALAPGLIVIIAVAALVLGKVAAQGQIIDEVQDLVGVAGAQAIQAAVESAGSAGSSLRATSLGVITS